MRFTKATIPSAVKAILRVIRMVVIGRPVIVKDKVYAKRLATCFTCEFYEAPQCAKCTCVVFVKCKLTTEVCPVGKW